MICRDVEERITAYLDGELDATTSSALRGHLRTCAACKAMSEDHARIAGTLAAMHDQPLDPSAQLWDRVLSRVAEAEEADAKQSRWTLSARSLWQRLQQHLVAVTAVGAAAVLVLVWWSRQDRDASRDDGLAELTPRIADAPPAPDVAPPVPTPPRPPAIDVETALVTEAQRIDALYADVVEDLTTDALDERATWPAPRQHKFDAELTKLRAAVHARPLFLAPLDPDGDHGAGEARERAWQALVKFLQRAAVGDLVAEAR